MIPGCFSKKRKGESHPFLAYGRLVVSRICVFIIVFSAAMAALEFIKSLRDDQITDEISAKLPVQNEFQGIPVLSAVHVPHEETPLLLRWKRAHQIPGFERTALKILPQYEAWVEVNPYFIGWLRIPETEIDYPVVQTPWDETYYLYRDFYGSPNKNGTLTLDTDSFAGIGVKENQYAGGTKPSTNLIIHGHAMFSGKMFGRLHLYADEEYGRKHSLIQFDSLYESREYELISVFYSEVFYRHQDVFKYYNFFQANSQQEFDAWYQNIKSLSLYDTEIEAVYGDEFITLSTCSYHKEDGRFVVIGKRK